jgi:hypothetical protein
MRAITAYLRYVHAHSAAVPPMTLSREKSEDRMIIDTSAWRSLEILKVMTLQCMISSVAIMYICHHYFLSMKTTIVDTQYRNLIDFMSRSVVAVLHVFCLYNLWLDFGQTAFSMKYDNDSFPDSRLMSSLHLSYIYIYMYTYNSFIISVVHFLYLKNIWIPSLENPS